MAKTKHTYFSQQVFSKKFEGVEEYGVILRQRFRPVLGALPGNQVDLRETNGDNTQYSLRQSNEWRDLPWGRPI